MIAVTKTSSTDLHAPASETSPRVQSLDCLRAIACFLVILSHTHKYTTPGGWSIGAYGVGLFCVLSGYLITSILLRDECSDGRINLIRFLQRRCLRILPAYFSVLLPCSFLMATGFFLKNHGSMVAQTINEFPFFVTLTHNLGDGIGINHLWSISVEEQFYCFLPLLLVATTWCAKTAGVQSLIRQVVMVAVSLYMVPYALLSSGNPYFCNAAFISLMIGSLLAMNFSKLSNFLTRFNAATIFAAALALVAASMLLELCPYGPLYSFACALIVWWATSKFQFANALKPIAYIGKVSFGVYLIHLPVCLVTYWYMSKLSAEHCVPLEFAINTAISILLGALSWEFFEKRILSLRDKVENSTVGFILALVSPVLLTIGVVLHLIIKT